jgi:hypothetical protein
MGQRFLTRRGSIVGGAAGAFMLALVPSRPRAEGPGSGVDVGAIADAITDLVTRVLARPDKKDDKRLQSSAVSVSARMSRVAAMKRSFADSLQDKPARMDAFPPPARESALHELRRIDREIAGLQADLQGIDPNWPANHPELHIQLFRIRHGKGLAWAAEYGPDGAGEDVDRLRGWMTEEAKKLEDAASAINARLRI